MSDAHTRHLRSVDNALPRVPPSFTITAAKFWNDIPLQIRNIQRLEACKRALKSHFLNMFDS